MKKYALLICFIINQNSSAALDGAKFELVLDIAQAASCVAYNKSKEPAYKKIYLALRNKRHKMHNNEGPMGWQQCATKSESVTRAYALPANIAWYFCNSSDSFSLIRLAELAIHETAHLVDVDRKGFPLLINECRARDHELSILSLATGHYESYNYFNKKCPTLTYSGKADPLDDDSMIDFLEDNRSCELRLY